MRGRTYAFVGFERVGGVIAYDVTVPSRVTFVTYVSNRDVSISVEDDGETLLSRAGDLGPEGLAFIPAPSSPTRTPLLAVASEVSGTTTLLELESTSGRPGHGHGTGHGHGKGGPGKGGGKGGRP